MGQSVVVYRITRFINLDTKHDIRDIRGEIVPSGIARTIVPPPNSTRIPVNNNLAALEFFTNYDKELIDKVRAHKVSTGVWF